MFERFDEQVFKYEQLNFCHEEFAHVINSWKRLRRGVLGLCNPRKWRISRRITILFKWTKIVIFAISPKSADQQKVTQCQNNIISNISQIYWSRPMLYRSWMELFIGVGINSSVICKTISLCLSWHFIRLCIFCLILVILFVMQMFLCDLFLHLTPWAFNFKWV